MTNFSTNQVMQFYVADGKATASADITGRGFSMVIDGKRTDVIENVLWATRTAAAKLDVPSAKVTIDVNSKAFINADDVLNGAIGGENYIVRVSYPDLFGAGIESWTTKTVVAQAVADDDSTKIIEELKKQLTAVLPDFFVVAGDLNNITIHVAPDTTTYERGVRPISVPQFTVSTNEITKDGVGIDWAVVTTDKVLAVVNGSYKLADMEYFALGERGDEYRMMGWPNTVKTEYKITPSDDAEYDVLVVHYAYKGDNANSHYSEKDLIVAGTAENIDQVVTLLTGKKITVVTK